MIPIRVHAQEQGAYFTLAQGDIARTQGLLGASLAVTGSKSSGLRCSLSRKSIASAVTSLVLDHGQRVQIIAPGPGRDSRRRVIVDTTPQSCYELLKFFGGTPFLPASVPSLRVSECLSSIRKVQLASPAAASIAVRIASTTRIGFACLNWASGELSAGEWSEDVLLEQSAPAPPASGSSPRDPQCNAQEAGCSLNLKFVLSQTRSSSCMVPISLIRATGQPWPPALPAGRSAAHGADSSSTADGGVEASTGTLTIQLQGKGAIEPLTASAALRASRASVILRAVSNAIRGGGAGVDADVSPAGVTAVDDRHLSATEGARLAVLACSSTRSNESGSGDVPAALDTAGDLPGVTVKGLSQMQMQPGLVPGAQTESNSSSPAAAAEAPEDAAGTVEAAAVGLGGHPGVLDGMQLAALAVHALLRDAQSPQLAAEGDFILSTMAAAGLDGGSAEAEQGGAAEVTGETSSSSSSAAYSSPERSARASQPQSTSPLMPLRASSTRHVAVDRTPTRSGVGSDSGLNSMIGNSGGISGLRFRLIRPGGMLQMDASAMRSLLVVPPRAGNGRSRRSSGGAGPVTADRTASLVGLLDTCRTAAGSRLLRQWVTQPSTSLQVIQWRHDCVEQLARSPELLDALRSRQFLRGSVDLEQMGAALGTRQVSLKDLVDIYEFVTLRLPDSLEVVEQVVGVDSSAFGEAGGGAIAAAAAGGKRGRKDREEESRRVPQSSGLASVATRLGVLSGQCEGLRKLIETTIDLEGALGQQASRSGSGTAAPSLSSLSGWAGTSKRYLVRPSALPSLASRHASLVASVSEVRRVVETVGAELGLGADKVRVEQNTVLGSHMRVPSTQQRKLYEDDSSVKSKGKGKSKSKGKGTGGKLRPGYTLISVQRDGVHFTTDTFSAAAAAEDAAEDNYIAAQAEFGMEVVRVASTYASVVTGLAEEVRALDALAAFASLVVNSPVPLVRPTMTSDDALTGDAEGAGMGTALCLEGLRHPVVEAVMGTDFIPNDVWLQRRDATEEFSRKLLPCFALVGGPNMGGKSTYIRSVALAVVMAQAGCFVPATRARMPVFDSLFARVGSADDQLRGVSSFMSEMLETSSLLRGVGHRSLVVLDEIGRGTSTHDGFGIAWAVAHRLASIGCVSLMATHFHELGELADYIDSGAGAEGCLPPAATDNSERPLKKLRTSGGAGASGGGLLPGRVRAVHMDARVSEEEVVMLFRVVPGMSQKSFGIQVAAGAGFPAAVIADAKAELEKIEGSRGT